MSETIREDNIREYLTAFADGELSAEQILSVLEYLAEHPEALQLMRAHQRVRVAAERAIRASTPPLPEDLRRRLEAMVPHPPSDAAGAWFRGRDWRLPALAAALLVAGVLVGRTALAPDAGRQSPPTVAGVEPAVPATTVAHATRVHADCSRLQHGLHKAGYPKELHDVSDLVRQDLSDANPHPDLAAIGYAYLGAGPCGEPLAGTVHLLYASTAAGSTRTVSVFVQRQNGQFDLEPGKLYVVSGPLSPFPMYAWRTNRVIYFLIADDEPSIGEVRQAIAIAPPR